MVITEAGREDKGHNKNRATSSDASVVCGPEHPWEWTIALKHIHQCQCAGNTSVNIDTMKTVFLGPNDQPARTLDHRHRQFELKSPYKKLKEKEKKDLLRLERGEEHDDQQWSSRWDQVHQH